MHKEKGMPKESAAETALRLLGGIKLQIVLLLFQKPQTVEALCRYLYGFRENEIKEALEELSAEGICKRQAEGQHYALTELGRETEPVLTALSDFGRLYQRLESLGIAPGAEPGFGQEQQEPQETSSAYACKEKTKAAETGKVSAKERHDWREQEGCFSFRNPHIGYEDWNFWGTFDRALGKATIRVVTEEEYRMLQETARQEQIWGEERWNASPGIMFDRAEVLPELESFYISVEDRIIEKLMGEC